MNKTKFTPGNWSVSPGEMYDILGTDENIDGNVVCLSPNALQALGFLVPHLAGMTNQERSMKFWPANQRLIVNAPKMYHMLETISIMSDVPGFIKDEISALLLQINEQ